MQHKPADIEAALIGVTIIFLLFAFFIIFSVILYRRRRNRHVIEKLSIEAAYKQEILKTQLEVQEDTLEYISRELHDNVNQVLSFVKLNLGLIKTTEAGITQKVTESAELIGETINELRNLSQSLSFERIGRLGLVRSIAAETEKIRKSGLLHSSLSVTGSEYPLGEQRELVFFRIFQESLNNIFKHAKATNVKVELNYQPDMFFLIISDDGKGFTMNGEENSDGTGLTNIKTRAKMVGANAAIQSRPGGGCAVTISLNTHNGNI